MSLRKITAVMFPLQGLIRLQNHLLNLLKWNVFMVTHVKIVLLCCSGGPSSVVVLGGSATSSGSIPSIPNSRKASASATPHPPPAPTNYDCLERVSLTGSVGGCGAPAEDQLTSSQPHHHHVIQQVWSLTQFYSVDYSKSRIDVKKCVFNKRTIKVCVSCC